MSSEITFAIEGGGFEQLADRLQAWGEVALEAADGAVVEAAADAADLARDAVPVDSGDLQRSITSERVAWGIAVVEAGGPSAPHVRPIEAATGFFNKSVDTIEADLRERIAGAVIEAAY